MSISNQRRDAAIINGELVVQDTVGTLVGTVGTFVANDATPSVGGGTFFKTANTIATTITDFDNSLGNGHRILIFFNDNYTVIHHDAAVISLPGAADLSFKVGDIMEFISISGVWYGWSARQT